MEDDSDSELDSDELSELDSDEETDEDTEEEAELDILADSLGAVVTYDLKFASQPVEEPGRLHVGVALA